MRRTVLFALALVGCGSSGSSDPGFTAVDHPAADVDPPPLGASDDAAPAPDAGSDASADDATDAAPEASPVDAGPDAPTTFGSCTTVALTVTCVSASVTVRCQSCADGKPGTMTPANGSITADPYPGKTALLYCAAGSPPMISCPVGTPCSNFVASTTPGMPGLSEDGTCQ